MREENKVIGLLIVDDDEMTRDGLDAALTANDEFTVRQAVDGFQGIEEFKRRLPDAVLLDLKMPGLNGLETMRELTAINNSVPIIIMTAYGDIARAVEAMKGGAYDFIVKPPKLDDLIATLKGAVRRREQGADRVAEEPAPAGPAADPGPEALNNLTGREREVFMLTVQGLTCSQVGERLRVSSRTVETHRENLMKKLNIHSKSDLIRFAIRCGLSKVD